MKRPQVELITCDGCGGRGQRPGPKTGTVMRAERESRSVTRPKLCAHFFKPDGTTYSERYVIDLETGARQWSNELVDSYRQAIELAVKERLEVVSAN